MCSGRSKESVHFIDLFVDFFSSQINRTKSAFIGFGMAQEGVEMFRGFGHTEWDTTLEIFGSTIKVEKDAQYGLAAGCRVRWKDAWRDGKPR